MKRVLITGASRGIGRAIAQKLLDGGCEVLGTSRDPDDSLSFSSSRFVPLQMDLRELVDEPQVLTKFAQQLGHLDAVILNAGEGRFGGLESFSHKQINQLLAVNLNAQIQLARVIIPELKKNNRGDMIFIGSESALTGGKQGSIYSASKFGLRGFTQALRKECVSHNIRISLINPGMVDSSFFDELGFKPGPETENSISPEQVADTVEFMLNSESNVVWDEINLSPLKKVVVKK